MQQSGFLYEIRPKDYILGSTSPLKGEELNPDGDWRQWAPTGEKQYDFKFDTMSCTTFSGTSKLETLFNFFLEKKKLSGTQEKWLKDEGYIVDGKFNFSDRFSATINGTMPNGNYFQNVWDSFRKDGLIPEKDHPFGGKNQAEYLDQTKITPAMRAKAKKFLEMIVENDGGYKINYEWVPVTNTGVELNDAFKQAPIQVAVTKEAPQHAILLLKMDWEFESYTPFLRPRTRTVAYALKAIVKIKAEAPVAPPQAPTVPKPPVSPITYKHFTMAEKTNAQGTHTFGELEQNFRALLDKMRGECGFPWVLQSGYRTQQENDTLTDSVSDSAHVSRLAADIACTDNAKRDKIVNVAKANGVKRIGIGKTFVHLDVDPSKPQNVMWHYYK